MNYLKSKMRRNYIIVKFISYENINGNNILSKKIKYYFSDTSKIKDLLFYLLKLTSFKKKNSSYDNNFINEYLLLYFDFINKFGNIQKAKLNFSLKKFLINFEYDFFNVTIIYNPNRGIGEYTEFEEIARIQINANEGKHNNPHVHITRIGKRNPMVRIDLKTLTQMNGDKMKWEKEFNNKERKKILSFLYYNREKLTDFYNRCRKGEHIIEEYILYFNGKKYVFHSGINLK